MSTDEGGVHRVGFAVSQSRGSQFVLCCLGRGRSSFGFRLCPNPKILVSPISDPLARRPRFERRVETRLGGLHHSYLIEKCRNDVSVALILAALFWWQDPTHPNARYASKPTWSPATQP